MKLLIPLAAAAGAVSVGLAWQFWPEPVRDIPLKPNMEQRDENGYAINPSTQSVNRYSSALEGLTRVSSIHLSNAGTRLEMSLSGNDENTAVHFRNVDYYGLVPLLPYQLGATGPDDFDKANLMLGEFARNGLALSYHPTNAKLGYFNDLPNAFFTTTREQDYTIKEGNIAPNRFARPKRFSIINNCLKAGRWEVSAIDAVGEMYHAWFNMPRSVYAEMIRRANKISLSDREVMASLAYRADLTDVVADLDRLRVAGLRLFEGKAKVVASKEIGAYSTQESRQKSQQKYFEVSRGVTAFGGVNKIEAKRFSDLEVGDLFSTRRFVDPGVYSANQKKTIPFDPSWQDVEILSVKPLTQFRDGKSAGELGDEHIEISLYSQDRQRRVVVGNIPLSLLVEQEDYLVPSFGTGVSPPWEFAERRFLRMTEGPSPHYAYQLVKKGDTWRLENNHEGGIEQIALRVVLRGDKTLLRVTFIAYERILDLLELEVDLSGALTNKLREKSSAYKPPLFRVYDDPNVI